MISPFQAWWHFLSFKRYLHLFRLQDESPSSQSDIYSSAKKDSSWCPATAFWSWGIFFNSRIATSSIPASIWLDYKVVILWKDKPCNQFHRSLLMAPGSISGFHSAAVLFKPSWLLPFSHWILGWPARVSLLRAYLGPLPYLTLARSNAPQFNELVPKESRVFLNIHLAAWENSPAGV